MKNRKKNNIKKPKAARHPNNSGKEPLHEENAAFDNELSEDDMIAEDAVLSEYENIPGLIKNPKSRQDHEHNAYLRLLHEYNNFRRKRNNCRKVGMLVIILLAVLFLIMMFSLDSKVLFLTLWVISIFVSVFVIIRIDYRCYKYAAILGINDNEEELEMTDK
ncbi:MAG: hypothetical protein II685_01050 [Clostridia bacterium]|nr:hypothetical protein [Clostridia bacterium]